MSKTVQSLQNKCAVLFPFLFRRSLPSTEVIMTARIIWVKKDTSNGHITFILKNYRRRNENVDQKIN